MNLPALQHLIRSAQILADDRKIFVLGSASLLASHPALGFPEAPLASTYDADLLIEPFEELTAIMLDEALGEQRAYFRRHGYHADILRASILNTMPNGWRDRLIPVPETTASALEPHDLAAVKLLVGRPKDLNLVRRLFTDELLIAETVKERLDLLEIPIELRPRLLKNFEQIFRD